MDMDREKPSADQKRSALDVMLLDLLGPKLPELAAQVAEQGSVTLLVTLERVERSPLEIPPTSGLLRKPLTELGKAAQAHGLRVSDPSLKDGTDIMVTLYPDADE